jgi:hypothetical protein
VYSQCLCTFWNFCILIPEARNFILLPQLPPWERPFSYFDFLVLIGSQTLQHPPDQNSLTPKLRKYISPKCQNRPTWCNNPKHDRLINASHGSLWTCVFSSYPRSRAYLSQMANNDSAFCDVTPCIYQATQWHSLIMTAMKTPNIISAVSCLLPYHCAQC